MTGTEIYKRTPLFEKAASNIRLYAPQWKVLLAFDGQRSLAEVALSQEVSFAEALPLTEKFLDEGWIEEQPITLDQYLKRTGAADVSAIGAAITPAIVLHEAKPVELEAPPVAPAASQPPTSNGPPPPLPTRPAAPVAAPVPARAPIAPVVKAAPIPAAAAAPKTKGSMRLKAVVDFIVSQVGNNSLGQLMVYRIFLRVSPQLLQDEDIASVHLANDPSVVKNEQLQRGIEEATMEVLKRPLPESVYSPA